MISGYNAQRNKIRTGIKGIVAFALVSSIFTVGLTTAASAASNISHVAGFPVNAEVSGVGSSSAPLTVSPAHVGDLVVLESQIHSQTIAVLGVTSPNITGWTNAQQYVDSTDVPAITEEIWYGTATAAGSTTITVNYSASVASLTPELVADSFTTPSTSTWSVVSHSGAQVSSSSIITFPSLLSSAAANQLYWGYAEDAGTASAGSTSGFTYTSTGATGNLVASNPALTATTTYTPTATMSPAGANTSTAVIFAAANAGATVTFNGNGSTSGSMTAETASTPTALTTNAFTRTGYTFAGWNTIAGGGGTAYFDGASYPFTSNATLYAQWTANASNTVTFNSNGGSGSMTAETASAPTALTPNAYSRTGYTFTGWNTAANGSGTAYANSAIYPFTTSTTLYAQWSASVATPATVTFNSNGGGGSMNAETASAPTALTPNAYSRTGYTFTGWNTAANGTGTSYANSGTYPFSASTTLYAQWSANSAATVTFNGNGATSGSMSAETANAPTALTANAYVRTGYNFTGWNTAANGTGTSYANSATYPFSASTTLYAQWAVANHLVHFVGNGATRGSMPVETHNGPSALSANLFVRPSWVFTGWNTSKDGSGTKYANGALFAFSTDTTLFAQWRYVVPVPHAVRVVGYGVSGATHFLTIIGSGFTNRSRVSSAVSIVRTVHASGSRLVVLVSVPKKIAAGRYTFVITTPSRKTIKISYSIR
jgi:uncharacterized repeat protein (TIGR02543 family)